MRKSKFVVSHPAQTCYRVLGGERPDGSRARAQAAWDAARACSECYVEGDKWNANHEVSGGVGSVFDLSAGEGEEVLLVGVRGEPLLVAGRSRVGFGVPR